MGKLYIPGEREIKGPWLIGVDELEELDATLDFIQIQINRSIDLEIENSVKNILDKEFYPDLETAIFNKRESLIKYHLDKREIKVILIAEDEKRLIDTSIKGILKDRNLKDFKPKELSIDIGSGYVNQFSLNIVRRFYGETKYKVKCFDQDCQEEIIYKIENWLEKYQPTKPKQIWSQYSFIFTMLSFICFFSILPFIFTTELPDFKTIYKNEINEIIKTGINKENEAKSIELLLKYVTDYKPEGIKEVKKTNKVALQFSIISGFVLLISWFKPKTTIGIGKHKSLLKIYNLYTKLVLVTLPAIFVMPYIIDWIKKILLLD